jgi:hypothetical protein
VKLRQGNGSSQVGLGNLALALLLGTELDGSLEVC